MKKSLVVILIVLINFYGYSQKIDKAKLPQPVKDAFKKAHPYSTATWEWEETNYEANFKEGSKTMSCVINPKGTILETETSIAASDLAANAKTYMNQHYKGKKWKEVAKIVKANGELNYEVNVGTDVLFDANGKYLDKKANKKNNK